jgi:hypothetical protein
MEEKDEYSEEYNEYIKEAFNSLMFAVAGGASQTAFENIINNGELRTLVCRGALAMAKTMKEVEGRRKIKSEKLGAGEFIGKGTSISKKNRK